MTHHTQWIEAPVQVPTGWVATGLRAPKRGEHYLWHGKVSMAHVDHDPHSLKVIVMKDETT